MFRNLTAAGIETLLNRYLALDPKTRSQFSALHGRVIAIDVLGLATTLYLIPGPQQLQVVSRIEDEPDCTIRGTPMALSRMSDTENSSSQLFQGDVEISGDTELAHTLGKLFAAMDVDWEEQLSHYTGDLLAHQAGSLLRGLGNWGRNSLNTLGLDLQEYLQEEIHLLPDQQTVEDFSTRVDTLRDDVARAEARLERLTKALNGEEKAS